MVRQGPLVKTSAFFVATMLAIASPLAASARGQSKNPAPEPAGPIELEPYRIRVLVSFDPSARFDRARRDAFLRDWSEMVQRFVGAPWSLTLGGESESAIAGVDLEALKAEDLAATAGKSDKVWAIRVGVDGSGLLFSGRELDVTLARLGPLHRRTTEVVRDAPRDFFRFTLDLFSPYAEIGDRFGKDVSLRVRGAAVPPSSPIGLVVTSGSIFQPVRIVPVKDGKPLVREIPFTYLRVEEPNSTGARCSVVSVYSDPFTRRVVQKTSLAAIGVKAGKSPTRLRFQVLPDKAPAAGYVVTARSYPDGNARDVGSTDREGRITIDPNLLDGLVTIRALGGNAEPMIEFPYMPGENAGERLIPAFDPKPLTLTLETRLDSLRDEIIDLVAIRARLEARLKSRFDAEDWTGADEVVKEFRSLTPRDRLSERLAKLKDDAARQQIKAKTPILTKTAQAQIVDVQALIDRYLEEEVVKGYADALDKLREEKKPAKPKP